MLNHHSLAKLIQIPLKMDLRSTKVILRSLFCPSWSINQSIFGISGWNSLVSGLGEDWATKNGHFGQIEWNSVRLKVDRGHFEVILGRNCSIDKPKFEYFGLNCAFRPTSMKFWGQMRSFGSVNFIKWSNVTQWKSLFRQKLTKIGQLLTIFEKRDDSIAHFDIDIGLTSKSNLFQKVILDSFG